MDVASGRPCSSNASYHHHHLSHPEAGTTLPELRRLNSNNYKAGAAALSEVPPLDMNLMNGDFLGIDDLLDFTNEDIGGPIEQGEASCTVDHDVEPTAVLVPAHDHQGPKACSTKSTGLSPAGASLFDSEGGPGHLCVPCDDLADLEWLSNFVEDSFSSGGDEAACNIFGTSRLGVVLDDEDVDDCKRMKKSRGSFDGDDIGDNGSNNKSQQRSGSPVSVLLDNSSSTITSTTSSSCTTTTTASDGGAIMSGKPTHASRGTVSRGVGSKPRSKRPRPAAVCFWNTRILSNDGCGSVLLHPPRQQQQESHNEDEEEEEEDDDTMSPSHCDDDDQSESEYDSDAPAALAPRFFIGSSHTSSSPYYYDHVAGRKVPAHHRGGGSGSSSNKKQLYRTPPRGGAGSAGTATKRQQQQQQQKKKKKAPAPAPAQWDCDDDVLLQQQQPVRRCLHCAAQKTPQWRAGPMGPKTLCNACGVRYKSGRLLPEYRPAASPTFVESIHSNSHRRVLEMRRQRYEQPCASPSTSAGAPAPPPPPLPPRQQAPVPRIITISPKTVASPSPSPSPSSSSGHSLEQPPSSASPQHSPSYHHLHPHHHHRPPSAVISMAGVSC